MSLRFCLLAVSALVLGVTGCKTEATVTQNDTAVAGADAAGLQDLSGTSSTDTLPSSPDSTSDTGTPVGEPACAPLAKDCKFIQQGCTLKDGKPKCTPCTEGQAPQGDLAVCAPIPGKVIAHDFGVLELEVAQEEDGWCQSFALNNAEELWVNAVEFISDGGYHHSNWFFVPEGSTQGTDPSGKPMEAPLGLWKNCYKEGFQEVSAALAGGVLFAQSTQVVRDVQKFGEGIAVRIPPWQRVIGATHLLNVYPNKLATRLRMRIYTVPAAEVKTKLTPFRFSYYDLHIPPKGNALVEGTCDFGPAHEKATFGKPFGLRLHYALPHYHRLGTSFRLAYSGGPNDGKTIFEQGAFNPDPFGHVLEPPIDVSTGLTLSCGFANPSDDEIIWGIGKNEMCVMLGFAESAVAYDASVSTSDSDVTKDGTRTLKGPCKVVGYPFLQDKAGGTPPKK